VLGARAAVPIAGAIQIPLVDWPANHPSRREALPAQAGL